MTELFQLLIYQYRSYLPSIIEPSEESDFLTRLRYALYLSSRELVILVLPGNSNYELYNLMTGSYQSLSESSTIEEISAVYSLLLSSSYNLAWKVNQQLRVQSVKGKYYYHHCTENFFLGLCISVLEYSSSVIWTLNNHTLSRQDIRGYCCSLYGHDKEPGTYNALLTYPLGPTIPISFTSLEVLRGILTGSIWYWKRNLVISNLILHSEVEEIALIYT